MKKILGASSILLLTINFASALNLPAELGKGMSQLLDMIASLLGPFFGAILGGSGDALFQKILFLAIIISIVYVIVKNINTFKGNDAIIWVITISVSLLATRFMSTDMLSAMLLPYTALGIALSSALPLMIFFFFVQAQASSTLRKVLWAFLIAIFLTIWSVRYSGIGVISYIYLGGAGLAFIFLLFDGTIRKEMNKIKAAKKDNEGSSQLRTAIRKHLGELEEDYKNGYVEDDYYEKTKKRLERQLKNARK